MNKKYLFSCRKGEAIDKRVKQIKARIVTRQEGVWQTHVKVMNDVTTRKAFHPGVLDRWNARADHSSPMPETLEHAP